MSRVHIEFTVQISVVSVTYSNSLALTIMKVFIFVCCICMNIHYIILFKQNYLLIILELRTLSNNILASAKANKPPCLLCQAGTWTGSKLYNKSSGRFPRFILPEYNWCRFEKLDFFFCYNSLYYIFVHHLAHVITIFFKLIYIYFINN